MIFKRVMAALFSAALLLTVAACEQQAGGDADQGAAPPATGQQ